MITNENDRKRVRLQPAESSSPCCLHRTNTSVKQEWSQGPHEIMDINSKIAKFLRSGSESLTVHVSSATIREILVREYTNAGWEVTESGNEVTINLKPINEV